MFLTCGAAVAVNMMSPAALAAAETCTNLSRLAVVAASDDGSYDASYAPESAIDADFDPQSRWSSENVGKQLILNLVEVQTIEERP